MLELTHMEKACEMATPLKDVKTVIKYKQSLVLAVVLLLMLLPAVLTGCSSEKTGSGGMDEITSYEQLNKPEYQVGVINGGLAGPLVEKKLPKAQLMYFNSMTDLLTALENKKLDAIIDDDIQFIYYKEQVSDDLRLLEGYLRPFDLAFIFDKTDRGKELNAQVSEYIEKLRKEGTLEKICDSWLKGEAEMAVDYEDLPAENGVIKMATTSASPPFSFTRHNHTVGIDLDIISRFCAEYGYGLQIESMNFDGIIPSVSSGKCDLGGNSIGITEERAESVFFSAPYLSGGTAAAVHDSRESAGGLAALKASFQKTFIKDHRYRLFGIGILRTLLITVLAALFGTILGFLVFMCCRGGNRIAVHVTKVCVWLIQGMPVVVLLMILYYIVFSNAPVSGTFVSVVAFTMTFGASVYGMLRSSVGTVDKGQTEAAYALGFSNLGTFFRIVLPQALVHFLPSYKAELVSLIKGTAVVGYIAVQDLTRVGDIIRSQTYEAFFPLIAVAVIYFLLAGILIFIVSRIQLKVDPKRRKREKILQGVKIREER